MQQPFFAIKQANEKVSKNKHKAKGLGQAFSRKAQVRSKRMILP